MSTVFHGLTVSRSPTASSVPTKYLFNSMAHQKQALISYIKLCAALRQQYSFDAISLMPTNMYGPGDNYHHTNSHVLPAMIRRFRAAKDFQQQLVAGAVRL